ncbi:MAG: lipopolysaccharide biosynthesis protein [Ferruginibacter sp.]
MSEIRKKGLVSTFWIYIGFAIGALNTFLFARKGFFNPQDYGLATGLIQIGLLLSSFSAMGCYGLLHKFFPYYRRRLSDNKNDLFSLTLMIAVCGFIVVGTLGAFVQPLILKKFGGNSPELVHYFYYSYLLAAGFLFYSIFEYQGWNLKLQLFTNILKEVVIRIFVLLLILLKLLGIISFHQFLFLYCFQYLFIAFILLFYFIRARQIHLTTKISFVTIKFRKVILKYLAYGFTGTVVNTLRTVMDVLVLSSLSGLVAAGVYTLASFVATIIQAPYRSLISITIPILSNAWKEKNYKEINRIYKRSSINLLLFSIVTFGFIWVNFEPFVYMLHLNKEYLAGKNVLLILSIANIIEMGTGVNGQIIGTSTLWKFEFYTNIILGIIITTCSYFFTKYLFGINGPALALLAGIIVYNFIRIYFLYKKYNFLPFNKKTVVAITLLPFIIFFAKMSLLYLPFYMGLILANGFMATLLTLSIYKLNISPDVKPIVHQFLRGIKK